LNHRTIKSETEGKVYNFISELRDIKLGTPSDQLFEITQGFIKAEDTMEMVNQGNIEVD